MFTRIIEGELPARFVWKDDRVVAFLSINPISVGHTLVVPRQEVDHWLDLDDDLWQHVSQVSKRVGEAIQRAFDPPRVGSMIAGFEVPHVHVHVLQIADLADLNFSNAESDPDEQVMDDAAGRIRAALEELGHSEVAGS